MDVDARLEAVETENELLRERCFHLEGLLGLAIKAPLVFGLTPHESGVFGILMSRDIATKDMLMAAIYRDFGKDEPMIKIVDVFVCKIRKKLKGFGVVIDTVWGQGWRITPTMKDHARTFFDVEPTVAA